MITTFEAATEGIERIAFGSHTFAKLTNVADFKRWMKATGTVDSAKPPVFPCLAYDFAGYDEDCHVAFVTFADIESLADLLSPGWRAKTPKRVGWAQ